MAWLRRQPNNNPYLPLAQAITEEVHADRLALANNFGDTIDDIIARQTEEQRTRIITEAFLSLDPELRMHFLATTFGSAELQDALAAEHEAAREAAAFQTRIRTAIRSAATHRRVDVDKLPVNTPISIELYPYDTYKGADSPDDLRGWGWERKISGHTADGGAIHVLDQRVYNIHRPANIHFETHETVTIGSLDSNNTLIPRLYYGTPVQITHDGVTHELYTYMYDRPYPLVLGSLAIGDQEVFRT